jgi:hypothetical protein
MKGFFPQDHRTGTKFKFLLCSNLPYQFKNLHCTKYLLSIYFILGKNFTQHIEKENDIFRSWIFLIQIPNNIIVYKYILNELLFWVLCIYLKHFIILSSNDKKTWLSCEMYAFLLSMNSLLSNIHSASKRATLRSYVM